MADRSRTWPGVAGTSLCLVGAAGIGWSLMIITNVGAAACETRDCGPTPLNVTLLVVAAVMVIAGIWLHPWAVSFGGVPGMIAGAAASASRYEPADYEMIPPLAVATFLGSAFVTTRLLAREDRDARRKLRSSLVRSGRPAVAEIRSVSASRSNSNPTVTEYTIEFALHPVGGGGPFPATDSYRTEPQDVEPRVGLAWPAIVDPADPDRSIVELPPLPPDPATTEAMSRLGLGFEQVYGFTPFRPSQ